jgi:hypothetical protein
MSTLLSRWTLRHWREFSTNKPGQQPLCYRSLGGWPAVDNELEVQGRVEFAHAVRSFMSGMPASLSESEYLRARQQEACKTASHERERTS